MQFNFNAQCLQAMHPVKCKGMQATTFEIFHLYFVVPDYHFEAFTSIYV